MKSRWRWFAAGLVLGVLSTLLVQALPRPHWLIPWARALAHPTDPVVAATLVLVGAFLTVVSAQLIGHLTRRHEMEKAMRGQLFEPRATVYIAAIAFLQDKGLQKTQEEQEKLAAELLLYGSEKLSTLWVDANAAYRKSQDAPDDEQLKDASALAFRAYISQAQAEVWGHRK